MLFINPTIDLFIIQLNTSSILEKVSIYYTLDYQVLDSGFYMVEITTNTGKASKKLIIE